MKGLGKIALIVGIISLVIGGILRIAVKEVALGLAPSSFLELSIAAFLLSIAINTAK